MGTSNGNGVEIRDNDFIGGDVGVNTFMTVHVTVEGNRFAGHRTAAVNLGGPQTGFSGAVAVVRGNSVAGCGPARCVLSTGVASLTFTGNVINVAHAMGRTNAGIEVAATSATIEDNQFLGTGGTRVAGDASTWPIGVGVQILRGTSATVSRNVVRNASIGMRFAGSSSSGTDNVVDGSQSPLAIGTTAVALRRSDFTGYLGSALALFNGVVPGANSLTCNWWGAPTGPVAMPAAVPASAYTPVASTPIAGTAVGCPAAP